MPELMFIKYRDFIEFIAFIPFASLRWLFRLLPRKLCLASGQAFGALLFRLDRRHRRLALANLEKALGRDLPSSVRTSIAKDSFHHFGRTMADNLKWMHWPEAKRKKFLRIEGEEHIRQALQEGRGVLLFSAHFGNWEVASLAVSKLARLSVVARALDNRLAERELSRFRRGLGASVIYKQRAAKSILQALRRNEIVAILIDQNVLRREAVFVDFFGLPAATTPSLASFCLRVRSPLLPVFCTPLPGLSYLVKIGTPLQPEPAAEGEDPLLKITQQCTKIIEAEIRAQPSLWFWFHDRWRTRPESEAGKKGA